jgi:hypothetical protein
MNYGHGWYIKPTTDYFCDNQFSNCFALDNSRNADNQYDGFLAAATSGGCVFTGCVSEDRTGAVRQRYGFNDLAASDALGGKNRYVGCRGTGKTKPYKMELYSGSSFEISNQVMLPMAVNSATPDVSGSTVYRTENTSATTITAFINGVPGQRITLICGDDNTTLQHNGVGFSFLGNGDRKLRNGRVYHFVNRSGDLWLEQEEYGLAPQTNGDANALLKPHQHGSTQVFNTPLTADRTVWLDLPTAYPGAKFRIVRTAAATGAFVLNLHDPLLTTLAAGESCDVEYVGSAWVVTGKYSA